MRLITLYTLVTFYTCALHAQHSYTKQLETHRMNYVRTHEVVLGKDRDRMSFFPIDEKYRITCRFERKTASPWFLMESSGTKKANYRVYGTLHFTLNDTAITLNIYQSQSLMSTEKYRDHLFIPFTDLTTGESTYESGRYLDLEIDDIKDDSYIIDFNKAYNPYCAYVADKYNCPLPPRENHLEVAILAGEKAYQKR